MNYFSYLCTWKPIHGVEVKFNFMNGMDEKEKQSMIEDAMVVLSGDLFSLVYDSTEMGWVGVTNEIKAWAREFVEQLNWKGYDDERDWLLELEAFEYDKMKGL
jgi:hypothetical protein